MTFDYPVERIIGFDKIEGYLCKDGRVVAGALSSGSWDDVAMSREVYAARGREIKRFSTIKDLLDDTNGESLTHPALSAQNKVYATESKVFVQTTGTLSHFFEIVAGRLELVEELEGVGIINVITGALNRIGVITDSGDAYLYDKGWELLEGVIMLGVGSDFEIAVTEERVLVRGKTGHADPQRDMGRAPVHPTEYTQRIL